MSVSLTDMDILLRPIITEKTNFLMEENKYTFEVHSDANKYMIKSAVERVYSVKVETVNVMNVKPKPKKRGVTRGKTRSWKKAIVKLSEGYSIPELQSLR
jgi:large subunit ribosomal protein L23